MSMNKLSLAGGAMLVLSILSAPLYAAEDRFDYFGVQGTGSGELKGGGDTTDVEEGVSLEAAKSLNDVIFLRGTVDTYNFELLPGVTNAETGIGLLSIGPGVGLPLGWAHLYGQVSYDRLDFGGLVGDGPGVEVGAMLGPADGPRVALSAHRGEPNFSDTDDIEYDLYTVEGMLPVSDRTDIVLSYQEGTFDTGEGDIDLNEVVGLGVRLGF